MPLYRMVADAETGTVKRVKMSALDETKFREELVSLDQVRQLQRARRDDLALRKQRLRDLRQKRSNGQLTDPEKAEVQDLLMDILDG